MLSVLLHSKYVNPYGLSLSGTTLIDLVEVPQNVAIRTQEPAKIFPYL